MKVLFHQVFEWYILFLLSIDTSESFRSIAWRIAFLNFQGFRYLFNYILHSMTKQRFVLCCRQRFGIMQLWPEITTYFIHFLSLSYVKIAQAQYEKPIGDTHSVSPFGKSSLFLGLNSWFKVTYWPLNAENIMK